MGYSKSAEPWGTPTVLADCQGNYVAYRIHHDRQTMQVMLLDATDPAVQPVGDTPLDFSRCRDVHPAQGIAQVIFMAADPEVVFKEAKPDLALDVLRNLHDVSFYWDATNGGGGLSKASFERLVTEFCLAAELPPYPQFANYQAVVDAFGLIDGLGEIHNTKGQIVLVQNEEKFQRIREEAIDCIFQDKPFPQSVLDVLKRISVLSEQHDLEACSDWDDSTKEWQTRTPFKPERLTQWLVARELVQPTKGTGFVVDL